MQIPSHILKAPIDYLPDEMVDVFRRTGYGAIPNWTSHGCALFVHMDSKTIKNCRHAVHNVNLELYEVDGCPLIRIFVKIYDRLDSPLALEGFLNITREDEHDLPAILALTEQEWFVLHWYDENLKYVRSTGVPWGPEQRSAAKEIVEKARAIMVRTGGGNFDRAKEKFIKENPL